MSWRRIGIALLALAAFLAALFIVSPGIVPPGKIDPAIEFYTKAHGTSYGGIDRWAYHGMKADTIVELLKKDGYVCLLPQTATIGGKLNGKHDMACSKDVRWPLSRTLAIKASIDYDKRGRLVAASASSAVAGGDHSVSKRIADFFRNRGWIEPEKLQIKGFEVGSIDLLTRLAMDALASGGWHGRCNEGGSAPACGQYARQRRESGFPALAQGAIAVGGAMAISSAMERVHLMPVHPRGADKNPEDSLVVRVTDEKMWIDFAGRDLTGRELMISVELDIEGGAPVRLVAKLGQDSKTLALAGTPRRANSGAAVYLLPEAGEHNPRVAVWLDMPNESYPGTFKQLAAVLPNIDTIFIPRILKTVIASISTASRPEESLGLYPALRSIEHQADILRLAHAELWLPGDQSNQLIKQAYQDDPATRAVWALATCESTTKPAVIDANCWLRFTAADPDATALLRSEVAALQVLYAELKPTHPLRLRLKRLDDALPR